VWCALAALLLTAAISGWWGLTRQGLTTWDEGVYFDEARFVIQTAGAVRRHTSIADATTGFAPRMGRPGNTALNVVAMAVLGCHPWAPAALAALFGLACIYCTYCLGRRVFGEGTGLLAGTLLALSPYFLQYRRLGLPEAAGTFAAVLVLLRLVALRGRDEQRPWLNSLTLGLLLGAGFTINMRLGVLLPVAALFRLYWLPGERKLARLAGHAIAMVGGVAIMALLFELAYLALGRVMPGGPPLESYFQQLARFAQTQQHMGRPPLLLAYLAPAVFLACFDLPALGLAVVGILSGRAWRQAKPALLLACVLVQVLSLGLVAPFARYLSCVLPLLMIFAAYGFLRLCVASRPRLGVAPVVVLGLLVLAHAAWRGAPILAARGQMSAAAAWLQARAPSAVATSDASLLLAYFGPTDQLPTDVPQARAMLTRLRAQGPCYVLLDRQQFMAGPLLMPPEQYDRTAGAIIAHRGVPVWQARQFTGLFLPFAFEHSWDVRAALRTVRGRSPGEDIAIYTAAEALGALAP